VEKTIVTLINGWTKVCLVVWLYLALEAQIPDKLLSTHWSMKIPYFILWFT